MRIFLCFTGSRGSCFIARRANQRPFYWIPSAQRNGAGPVPRVHGQSGVPRRRKRRSSGARFSCPGAALLLLRFRGQTLRWFARGGGRGMRIFLCFTGSRGFCFTACRANQRPFETAAAPGRSFTAAPNNPGGHTGSGGSARCLQRPHRIPSSF